MLERTQAISDASPAPPKKVHSKRSKASLIIPNEQS
jgi:hypothetical protein